MCGVTDNCGTKYGHNADCPQYCGQMRTNAENCGQIADKCEHAGINFLTWKGKIVYLLVTLDTTKKIQSCMFDTYVIPKYAY